MLPDVVWETRREKTQVQVFHSGDRDSIPIKKCPFPSFCLKEFIEERIIDDPQFYFSLYFQGDGNAEKWEPMNIVRRSVDGVNDPLKWRTLPVEGALLSEEIMIRECVKNDLVNRLLAELIHLADGVDLPFEIH